ncbi:IS110 family transposase [Desulfofarcimen acetoxidans]|uniref:IS110 family transposase n=1 Tax=Desulfofarcimen acetoxidans TaxID=58138 RepID=UPI00019E6472|nr:IS110 family transposase [Desulfofarcimen acetoxidans]
MKKLVIDPKYLVVGIDITKSIHWVQCIDPFGNKLGKPFAFQNNREGFKNLVLRINECSKNHGFEKVVFGMEPTDHYGKALVEYLVDLEHTFVLVNPMHVKKSKEFNDNSPSKNDRKDAYTIGMLTEVSIFQLKNSKKIKF